MTEFLRTRTEPVRNYELVTIYRAELDQEKLDSSIKHVTDIISQSGGEIETVDRWGKRKLAYPISQQLEGIYVLIKFAAGSSLVKKITADLRLSENVLRHMAIKL